MSDYIDVPYHGGLADLIDELCTRILTAWEAGERMSHARVSTYVYDTIARERAAELAHGNPMLLLDMELIRDPDLSPDQTVLV